MTNDEDEVRLAKEEVQSILTQYLSHVMLYFVPPSAQNLFWRDCYERLILWRVKPRIALLRLDILSKFLVVIISAKMYQ